MRGIEFPGGAFAHKSTDTYMTHHVSRRSSHPRARALGGQGHPTPVSLIQVALEKHPVRAS